MERKKWVFKTTSSPAFQFPSNGKGHGKVARQISNKTGIGFNSLQTGKGMESLIDNDTVTVKVEVGFNSLQTGKGMESAYVGD